MQTVTIDLIPQKEKPIVKLSQYDNDRQVRFMLEENGEPYTLTGTETVEVNIRKPDRNIVVIEPTIAANAYVDVLFTEQSAACYGDSFGELSIKSGETVIGTCNFIIDVEISPIYGGIASATEINNLETQIEEIITEVLSNDYYTKTETDDLLSAKADASDVYTKTQTDTLLSAKANASEVYTKTEVNNIILDIMPVDTASGPIATFDTELAVPLVNVSCDITASGGNGTPVNPNPIVGYSEANITANGNVITVNFGQTVYGCVLDVTRGKLHVTCAINEDMSDLSWIETSIPHVFYAGVSGKKAGYTSFLLCEQYTKYEGYVSGIDNNQISSNNSLEYIYVRNDNCTTVSDITTALSNCKLVYELATPFDIDLTPVQIRALVGTNNVFADTNGNTTVKFKDTIQNYIDKKVSI